MSIGQKKTELTKVLYSIFYSCLIKLIFSTRARSATRYRAPSRRATRHTGEFGYMHICIHNISIRLFNHIIRTSLLNTSCTFWKSEVYFYLSAIKEVETKKNCLIYFIRNENIPMSLIYRCTYLDLKLTA